MLPDQDVGPRKLARARPEGRALAHASRASIHISKFRLDLFRPFVAVDSEEEVDWMESIDVFIENDWVTCIKTSDWCCYLRKGVAVSVKKGFGMCYSVEEKAVLVFSWHSSTSVGCLISS